MQSSLQSKMEADHLVAAGNLRIRYALDKASTNIMLADNDGLIVYCNEAVLVMLRGAESDIRKELPETHLSTLEDIAGLIEAQPDGSPGFLLNNGYANIFYVEGKNGEVFAVAVRWRSVRRRWYVDDWELDEHGYWCAGYQVLCPGNAAL